MCKIASCTPDGTSNNACRNLARLIAAQGLALPLEVYTVPITCRRRKPVLQDFKIEWPMISMRSWCSYLLNNVPELLLGGFNLHDPAWPQMFSDFWRQWRLIEPDHPIFRSGRDLSHHVPFYTHGDEGTGLRKVAYLVQSFQPCLSWKGEEFTNLSGCCFVKRINVQKLNHI